MSRSVFRWAGRRALALALATLAVFGVASPRSASAGTSRWLDGEELIVRVTKGASTADLLNAAKKANWNCSQFTKSPDPAYVKDLWVLRPKFGATWTPTATFLSTLQKTRGVALAVRNTRTTLVRPASGVYSIAPSTDGHIAAGQSEMPAFDDELTLAVVQSQPALDAIRVRQPQATWPGTGTTIAVLDGGFDLSHQLLQGRLATGAYDAVAGDTDVVDKGNGIDDDRDGAIDRAKGHGTAVAGVIALTAPGAKILPIRILDDEGRGSAATITLGVRSAMEKGAKVIVIASGNPEVNALVEEALRDASAKNILIVCGAGNDGVQPANYPSSSTYCLCVVGTAVDKTYDPNSRYGPTADLGAPSVSILAPSPRGATKYARWWGTSFSAAWVAGSAAIVLQRNNGMTPKAAGGTLVACVQPYVNLPWDRTNLYGQGMLDVSRAVGLTVSEPSTGSGPVIVGGGGTPTISGGTVTTGGIKKGKK